MKPRYWSTSCEGSRESRKAGRTLHQDSAFIPLACGLYIAQLTIEWKPKMAANLHFQLNQGTRRFLFSGISSDFESSLCQKIERLQGRVVFPTTNMFSSLCTHVVAQEFSPTEKVLGALAGGKWLLTVNYITDSFEKGYWLHEEDYEYTTFNKVPAYHRCNRELKNKGLYEGWKVLVVMDSSKTTRTFKRILAAGGAEIASKEDTTDVDFVITTKDVVKYAQTLVSCFVPLVDVTYIKETILFATAYNTTSILPGSVAVVMVVVVAAMCSGWCVCGLACTMSGRRV
ncbi:SMC5-SMC6 complex localization factor protein 1 [Portunus trituberculatus]|uniref:SMC5-SMC6 complex localization factor protein 1 n=1 Tax=Portunus trituberculatus TaxID=210409 RepID=A0A5B7DUV0_PORTR|nr:SMC5-SMC6 complex localization factor protein 1 [Portunus trituberculatus]